MKTAVIKAGSFLVAVVVLISFIGIISAAETAPEEAAEPQAGEVKSLEERVEQLEADFYSTDEDDEWYDRIQISGLIEAEAVHQKIYFKDTALDDIEESDVDLASVDLMVDAEIVDHVDGHATFKFEDDDVFVDEGFIILTGTEDFAAYLIAGRQYIPFGSFDSHFITDPNTLNLGETIEGSVVAGYRFGGEMVDVSVGAFNGNINKDRDDEVIDSYVASIIFQLVEALTIGASYTSNLASSDGLSDFVTDRDGDGEIDPLDDFVGGWSAIVTIQVLNRFKLIGEYVETLDKFKAGEIYDAADTKERKPSAWNAELGAVIIDRIELAIRYGGSHDGGADFLPEWQYGAVLNWEFLVNTYLALEYMHSEFEDDFQDVDSFTTQLAVEF